jgi:ActR/RegA family two-component response regulator
MIPGNRPCVLLLDDDCKRRGYVRRYLEHRGYECRCASLRRFMSAAMAWWPDVVVIVSTWWRKIARRIWDNPYLTHVEIYGAY